MFNPNLNFCTLDLPKTKVLQNLEILKFCDFVKAYYLYQTIKN